MRQQRPRMSLTTVVMAKPLRADVSPVSVYKRRHAGRPGVQARLVVHQVHRKRLEHESRTTRKDAFEVGMWRRRARQPKRGQKRAFSMEANIRFPMSGGGGGLKGGHERGAGSREERRWCRHSIKRLHSTVRPTLKHIFDQGLLGTLCVNNLRYLLGPEGGYLTVAALDEQLKRHAQWGVPEETAASEKPKRRKKKADSATEAPAQKKAAPKRDDKLRFVEAAIERYLLSNKPKDVNGRICDVSEDQVIDGESTEDVCEQITMEDLDGYDSEGDYYQQ
ncbi:hypothetical protein FB45DRAFT_873755 [Roridomyces roridus]|uniref:Uncharacterized protein n=1 Tax=Roridomyces roridus TaxID=1738132 RepID=A0AAD7BA92_9AGAR|nr:hypothetical protein FB45DRAFT_873755 [Roridomyces roridus]